MDITQTVETEALDGGLFTTKCTCGATLPTTWIRKIADENTRGHRTFHHQQEHPELWAGLL